MSGEWGSVFSLAASLIERQPAPYQIFTWLGVAFVAVIFLEGLRASFLPSRFWRSAPRLKAVTIAVPNPKTSNDPLRLAQSGPRRLAVPARRNPKRDLEPPRRQKFPRPKITRVPNLALGQDDVREGAVTVFGAAADAGASAEL